MQAAKRLVITSATESRHEESRNSLNRDENDDLLSANALRLWHRDALIPRCS